MTREVTSKHIDGIADLVVVAPIREGFIDAYENVTFATRLRIVAEALHSVRVSAREHESLVPFSDTTERILTLLNFRIGILDKDLFQIDKHRGFTSRRYLFLAATFDGGLEPYMRLIWRPLGYFLDLLFCNCEGYKPAGDHSFADYLKWVRGAQVDSAIFYSTTGLTVRDQIYLQTLERLQRETGPAAAELALTRLTCPDREAEAASDRTGPNELEANILGLEALNVLYRLADYYPPDRLDPNDPKGGAPSTGNGSPANHTYAEGRYLLRATRSLLLHWDTTALPERMRDPYREQLEWFEGAGLKRPEDLDPQEPEVPDPPYVPSEIQAGIITSQGTADRPVRHGALLLMTVTDAAKALAFIETLRIAFEGVPPPEDGLYHNVAFTADGLLRLGLFDHYRFRFPKEFREGMEKRSGLLGDFRENHPRRWILPKRWPPLAQEPTPPRPPVDMGEVDFVLQLRYAPPPGSTADDGLQEEIRRLAAIADQRDSGFAIAAVEPMISIYSKDPRQRGVSVGHFKLADGLSQPRPVPNLGEERRPDEVPLGEILCGFRNDRGDQGPDTAPAAELQRNGSYLVIRKIEQRVEDYFDYLETESRRIAAEYQIPFTKDDLAGYLLGRKPDGAPLARLGPRGGNDFDYLRDGPGDFCPHASHVRRSNPRDRFHDRPAPRIMRHGMSFGAPDAAPPEKRGIMFMAYCTSIAEQFETIQRWVNGGNSSGVGSANNDPLIGVRPSKGDPVYRFVHAGKVIRTTIPKPLVKLHWGLYLFVPSRAGLNLICRFYNRFRDMKQPRETRGKALIENLVRMPEDVQYQEWKRILEDFDTKDPAESSLSPDLWSAVRYYKKGSYRIPGSRKLAEDIRGKDAPNSAPPADNAEGPRVVLVGSRKHVAEVLGDPETFSVEIQGNRVHRTSGDIYVAMQPGQQYLDESIATNQIMFGQTADWGFNDSYACAQERLRELIGTRGAIFPTFKIELRRDFLLPTLAKVCERWFGIPDAGRQLVEVGGWSWQTERKPRCPGDYLSPSRHAFYPHTTQIVEDYAKDHGEKIRLAARELVARYQSTGIIHGSLAGEMAAVIASPDVLARNIVGMLIGFLPPIDGNLRSILYEWLTERTLWRHQAALRRASNNGPAQFATARKVLFGPISRAMCKRPTPDLLLRVATKDHKLGGRYGEQVRQGDVVVVGLVSAAQRSLQDKTKPNGDVSIVFGGRRSAVPAPPGEAFHACPAYELMMGTIIGIFTALFEVGQIKAMPSSLIVEISNWKKKEEAAAPQPAAPQPAAPQPAAPQPAPPA